MSHRDDCIDEREAASRGRDAGRRHFNAGMGGGRIPEEIEGCERAEDAYRAAERRERHRLEEARQEEEYLRGLEEQSQ